MDHVTVLSKVMNIGVRLTTTIDCQVVDAQLCDINANLPRSQLVFFLSNEKKLFNGLKDLFSYIVNQFGVEPLIRKPLFASGPECIERREQAPMADH